MSFPRPTGFALPAVLVVITLSALAATTALFAADAQRAAVETVNRRTQSRALAWSGVQAVMAELNAQREQLLDGESPDVLGEWELFSEVSGVRGVVRLVDIDPASDGLAILSESCKLNVNHATSEMLVATGLLDESMTAAIVDRRASGPFSSAEGLLEIDGITPMSLYGLPGGDPATVGTGVTSQQSARPLSAVLTVFAFDPSVQQGLGEGGEAHRGKTKININLMWSEALGEAVKERLGSGASDVLKGLMAGGTVFKLDSEIVAFLRQQKVPLEQWGPILDAITTSDDLYRPGRVDINRAPAEILACIPGITAETAAAVVAERERLDSSARQSVTWPVERQVLLPEDFEKAVDWLSTRSMQWRVRVEAGLIRPMPGSGRVLDNAGADAEFSAGGAAIDDIQRALLTDRLVLEAVIDVSSQRPRIAYLREVTMLPAATRAAADAASEREYSGESSLVRSVVSADEPSQSDRTASATEPGTGDTGPTDAPRDGPREDRGETDDAAPVAPSKPPVRMEDRRIGRWTARGGKLP